MTGKMASCAAKLTVASIFGVGIIGFGTPNASAQSYYQGLTAGAGVTVDWNVLDSLGGDRAAPLIIAPDRAAPPAAYGSIPSHLDYIYSPRQSRLLNHPRQPGAPAMPPGNVAEAPSSRFFGRPSAPPSAAPQDRIVLIPPDPVAPPGSHNRSHNRPYNRRQPARRRVCSHKPFRTRARQHRLRSRQRLPHNRLRCHWLRWPLLPWCLLPRHRLPRPHRSPHRLRRRLRLSPPHRPAGQPQSRWPRWTSGTAR